MRVVYSPAHLGHEIRSQTQMGVQVPASEIAERAEVIRDALEADGGFEILGPTEHGEDPITAVHDPGLLAFLRDAWADTVAAGIPHGFLVPETIDNALDDGGHVRRRPPRPAAHRGPVGLSGARYLHADRRGDVRGVARRRRRGADRRGPRARRGSGRLRAVPAARPPRVALDVRRLLLLQQRRDRCRGDRPRHRRAPSRSSTSTTTTATAREQIFWRRGDVLYVSLHAHPDREYPYFLGWPEETGEGPGEGANLNIPLPAGDDERAISRGRWTAASSGSRTTADRRSWSRSASTPTGSTRWATSR